MTLVLTGATLIDGTGATPVPDAAVVIDGERHLAGPRRGPPGLPTQGMMSPANLLPGSRRPEHLASHAMASHALGSRCGQQRVHAHGARLSENWPWATDGPRAGG